MMLQTLFSHYTLPSFVSFFNKRARQSVSFLVLGIEYRSRISIKNKVERFGLRATRRTKKKAKPRSRSILRRRSSFKNLYLTQEDIFNEETNDRHPAITLNKYVSRVQRFPTFYSGTRISACIAIHVSPCERRSVKL